MRKIILFFFAAVLIFTGCTGTKTPVSSESADKAVVSEKEAVKTRVTLHFSEEEHVYNTADVRYDSMSDETIISGGHTDTEQGIRLSAFSLSLTGSSIGEFPDGDMDLKGYIVDKTNIVVTKYESTTSAHGGILISAIEGAFSGVMRQLDEKGFPKKEEIEFKGSFIK